MSSKQNCWDCGAPIPDGADHCPDCGLPATRPGEAAAPASAAQPPAEPPAERPRPEPKANPAGAPSPQLSRGTRNTILGVSVVVLVVVLFLLYLKKQPPAQTDSAPQADNGRVTADQQADASMPPGMPGSAPPLPADQSKQLDMLKQAVDKAPANYTHVVGLANTLYDAQRYPEAIPYYRKGLALVGTAAARDIPETAALDTRVDLATCLFHAGNHDEAIREIDSVLAKDPHHGNALYNKGVIAKMAGRTDEALASWKLYIQYHPEGPRVPDLKKEVEQMGAGSSGKKYP